MVFAITGTVRLALIMLRCNLQSLELIENNEPSAIDGVPIEKTGTGFDCFEVNVVVDFARPSDAIEENQCLYLLDL